MLKDEYNTILSLVNSGEIAALKMVIPAKYGKMKDISRSVLPMNKDNADLFKEGRPRLKLNNSLEYEYIEPYFSRERLIVLGGGHIAKSLVVFGKTLGFYVVVVDDREEFANEERFPMADEIICNGFTSAIKQISPTMNDYFVIVTRGHGCDTECVRALLKYEESVYVGMIGSKKRTSADLAGLISEGCDADRISHIHTPVGLNIKAVTPEEIGIAIMAEIIKVKRNPEMMESNIYINRSDSEYILTEKLVKADKPLCMVTIMSSVGSAPRKAGAKMLIDQKGTIVGSIGGGRLEGEIINKVKENKIEDKYEVMEINFNGEDAMAQGMVCGGKIVLLLEYFVDKL